MPGLEEVRPTDHGVQEEERLVYVAGPYTHGDWGRNLARVITAGQAVYETDNIPFLPHCMTGLWSLHYDNEWIQFDLKWLDQCDALIRIPGKSSGSDTEVEFAKKKGIPVYMSLDAYLNDFGTVDQRIKYEDIMNHYG